MEAMSASYTPRVPLALLARLEQPVLLDLLARLALTASPVLRAPLARSVPPAPLARPARLAPLALRAVEVAVTAPPAPSGER